MAGVKSAQIKTGNKAETRMCMFLQTNRFSSSFPGEEKGVAEQRQIIQNLWSIMWKAVTKVLT